MAAGTPESGTGTTMSVSTGLSRASSVPMRLRTAYTFLSSTTLSGRAK